MRFESSPEPLEAYLREVRKGLIGLPAFEIEEVLQELRSHVLDRIGLDEVTAERVLAQLGDAQAVARLNLNTRLAPRGQTAVSPMGKLLMMMRRGWLGARIVLASSIGYGIALCCLVLALAKLVAPAGFGLWLMPDASGDLSYSLGGYTPHSGGQDILGFWLVPLGLAIAAASAWLTYRYDCRQFRQIKAEQLEEGGAI